jgi:hypothetical protein
MDFRPEPSFYFEGGDLFYVELSITSFRNYISLVETSFAQQQKIISKKYTDYYKKLKESEHNDSFLHSTTSELQEIEEEFIQRFRNSILIQLFSYLENELKTICNAHSESTKSIYSVNDLKGNSDLDKIKKYLTKSMSIEVGKFTLWPFINNLRILRNKIVHENSTIQIIDSDLKSMRIFSKDKFLLKSLNPHPEFYNIIFDNREFLDECLNKTELFIQEIMKDYKPIY